MEIAECTAVVVCVCTDIMMAHVFSLFYALVSHSDIEV